MIQLEKYHGRKSRFTCPSCNAKNSFVRYQNENGEYISFDVGKCNRLEKCGYHYKPKQFFAENPQAKIGRIGRYKKDGNGGIQSNVLTNKNGLQVNYKARVLPKKIDYIEKEHLLRTLANYEQNAFVQFLLSLFCDEVESVWQAVKDYLIGTFPNHYGAYTCFSYLDNRYRFCRGKLIRFNQVTGKRLKGEFDTSSIVAKLKLKDDFRYKQIFFGEYLTKKYPERPIAIAEAEKTAVIASICKGAFPIDFVWLGAGSCTNLSLEKLIRFRNRKIILYPDANKTAFDRWQEIAFKARLQGLDVTLSTLLEKHATDEEKSKGFDLADYLISEIKQKNLCENTYHSLVTNPFFTGWTSASLF